jgi:hypothetical protein
MDKNTSFLFVVEEWLALHPYFLDILELVASFVVGFFTCVAFLYKKMRKRIKNTVMEQCGVEVEKYLPEAVGGNENWQFLKKQTNSDRKDKDTPILYICQPGGDEGFLNVMNILSSEGYQMKPRSKDKVSSEIAFGEPAEKLKEIVKDRKIVIYEASPDELEGGTNSDHSLLSELSNLAKENKGPYCLFFATGSIARKHMKHAYVTAANSPVTIMNQLNALLFLANRL